MTDTLAVPSAGRRGFLRGLAALPLIGGSVAVPVVAQAASCPIADAAGRYIAARAAFDAADEACGRATGRLAGMTELPVPAALLREPLDGLYGASSGRLGEPYGADDIARIAARPPASHTVIRPAPWAPEAETVVTREAWPEAQARLGAIVAAWADMQAERKRVEADAGLTAAEDAVDRAADQMDGLAAELAALQATTLAAVMRKAAFVLSGYEEGEGIERRIARTEAHADKVGLSLIRDLGRLAERGLVA